MTSVGLLTSPEKTAMFFLSVHFPILHDDFCKHAPPFLKTLLSALTSKEIKDLIDE